MDSNRRLALSVQRDPDWVGNHLPSTELGESSVGATIPFITVQLTDPATGATRVFMRGARNASQWRLMAILKQEVSTEHTCFDTDAIGFVHLRKL